MQTDIVPGERLLDEHMLAERLACSIKTIQKARLTGDDSFPPFVKIGRMVRYRASDVDRWIAERELHKNTVGYASH